MPIQSPLKYPGSKRDLEAAILKCALPFDEFREPFFGSGALSLRVAQEKPNARIRGREWNGDLVSFWNALRFTPDALAARVRAIRDAGLSMDLCQAEVKARLASSASRLERAALFFIANRSSFGGGRD